MTPACTSADYDQEALPYNATQQQKDMLEWHNKARTDPTSLVAELETMLTHFGGTDNKTYSVPGQISILTNEGKTAVQEAIDFLKTATPVSAVKWD